MIWLVTKHLTFSVKHLPDLELFMETHCKVALIVILKQFRATWTAL